MTPRTSRPVARRALLAGGAGLAASVALTHRLWAPDGLRQSIADIVRRLLGDDIAAEPVLLAFADFYIRGARARGSTRQRELFLRTVGGFPLAFRAAAKLGIAPITNRLGGLEYDIGQSFISNTNLAYREAGEPVRFEPLPPVEPYMCLNKLARFDDDD